MERVAFKEMTFNGAAPNIQDRESNAAKNVITMFDEIIRMLPGQEISRQAAAANEHKRRKGPPCSGCRSQRYAGAHYPAQPEEVERRRAFASTLETPAFLSEARAPASSKSPTEGSGRTSEPVYTGGLNHPHIRPSRLPTSRRTVRLRSDDDAGGGTQPNRQAARLRAASCPYEGCLRTDYGAAGDPPGAKSAGFEMTTAI